LIKQEPFEFDIAERARSDERFYIHIQATATRESFMKRGKASLPSLNSGLVAEPVFQTQELSSGLEHPADLGDRPSSILDAAERPGADHAIEAPGVERQFLGGLDVKLHVDAVLLNPAASNMRHSLPGINRREVTDVFRVILEVEPRPEPNLQDFSMGL
jgi:hypothetical protein